MSGACDCCDVGVARHHRETAGGIETHACCRCDGHEPSECTDEPICHWCGVDVEVAAIEGLQLGPDATGRVFCSDGCKRAHAS